MHHQFDCRHKRPRSYKRLLRFKGLSKHLSDALEQLSVMRKCPITFTDAGPGFVDTDLLADGKSLPFKMNVTDVASSIVKGIETKKSVLVIDWKYKLLVFFWRLVPQCLWKFFPIKS